MKIIESALNGILLLEPRVFGDDRGFFLESYNLKTMAELGMTIILTRPATSFAACIISYNKLKEN